MSNSPRLCRLVFVLAGTLAGACQLCLKPTAARAADELTLKNGMTVRGLAEQLESLIPKPKKKVDPDAIVAYPIVRVRNRLKTVYVPKNQIEESVKKVDLSQAETFKLPQTKQA